MKILFLFFLNLVLILDGELTLTDTFTTWLNAFLYPLIAAYSQMLEGFPFSIFSYIISAFLLSMVMQVVFLLLPPLRSVVEAIMFPFRILHVWLHIHTARNIIEKQPEEKNSLKFISYFSTGFSIKTEKTSVALSGICSPREASSIANAPLKGALALLMLLTLLTPFLRTSFIGKLIHLYIFTGIATTSFPSTSDYKFTYNMLLLKSPLSLSWILLPAFGFVIGFITVISWTNNIVFAIIWGIATSTMSTWILLMIMKWKSSKDCKKINKFSLTNCSSDETVYQPTMTTVDSYNNSCLLYQLENEH
ncbi:MAG: hypothetical protein ACXAEU_00140 [Candidatus Hodarchaeales archaeon]